MSADDTAKILWVDDDVNLLDAVVRQFRGKFSIVPAEGGMKGLQRIQTDGPFAVVVSDMRMPDMNGIQFLARARELSADTVRIMLTGNADLDTAMHAVNEGNIFRFLVKPCRKDMMEWAVEAALEQYQLVTAERELLEKTLKGSVQVLMDILALTTPLAFSRASRLKEYVSQLVGQLHVDKRWQYELAALLSQIGCVALPADILGKVYSGTSLTDEEQKMYLSHPELGGKLISLIPRMGIVGQMIAKQRVSFKSTGLTVDEAFRDPATLGAQVLKLCIDFDTQTLSGDSRDQVIALLKARGTEYHPALLKALEVVEVIAVEMETKEVGIRDLTDAMTLEQDIHTRNGLLVAPKGQKVTLSMRVRLENYSQRNEIEKRLMISMPSSRPKEVLHELSFCSKSAVR